MKRIAAYVACLGFIASAVAFHESPVGKHMLDSGPRMMQRVMERTPIVTREAMVEVCERVNARMQREKVPGKQAKCAEMMK
jgi:hypothetical protein